MNNVDNKKIKKKRRFRLTITQTVLIVLGLLAAIGMCVIFYYMYDSAKHSNKALSQNALISSDEDKSYLTRVVNANSGLSADTEINTSVVTGAPGIEVDNRITKAASELLADLRSAVPTEDVGIYAGYTSVASFIQAYNDFITEFRNQGYSTAEAVNQTLALMMAPGTDEHSTGLLINFGVNGTLDPNAFLATQANNWLRENAYKYGFVLRYPEGKEEITLHGYDPTAYRYVGEDNAAAIQQSGLSLEEYNEVLAQQAAAQAQEQAEVQAAEEMAQQEVQQEQADAAAQQ